MLLRISTLALLLASELNAAQAKFTYQKSVAPLLTHYCYDCHGNGKHKGDVALDRWTSEAEALSDRKTWERVMQMVQGHEMPPKKKPRPSATERQALLKWIDTAVFHCDCENPDPGRVTIRRLNRVEYNNTIRDLLGVNFQPAQDFPVDDSGYGFDNIGDALSLPPILIEKYLAAADKIVSTALGHDAAKPTVKRFTVDELELGYNAKQRGDGWVALNSVEEDDVAAPQTFATSGNYIMRVRAYARQDSTNAMKLTFMLDNAPIKVVDVETNQAAPTVYEAELSVPAGKHRLRAVVRRVKDGLSETESLKWKTGRQQKGAVFVNWLELEAPRAPGLIASGTRKQLGIRAPKPGKERETAREILNAFARRAYRRPVTKDELERLTSLAQAMWKRGEDFEHGLAAALHAVLVSPHFLFRGELQPEPDNPKAAHRINEFALASRLSYFLWSTMPDDELFAQAERGALRKNLDHQVRRMLRDAKSRALIDNFAGQWLQLRNLTVITPDSKTFPGFDEPLRNVMRRETELFFEHIMSEDRSLLEFLTADYTFANERLARHYGIDGVTGGDFQKVSLKGTPRRGVLTQGSILALTSNPTRTSPVKRGKWVLDNILNSPPPPPPPDVPELKEEKVLTGTLRQKMEQHRSDPLCASCHARMDPIGFAFENFDGIGAWREKEASFPIDASGELVTGEKFNDAAEFLAILSSERKDQFIRCLANKMLTYALGRGLEYYDKCALDEITSNLAKQNYKFSALILEIVKSTPFQKRRGDSSSLQANVR